MFHALPTLLLPLCLCGAISTPMDPNPTSESSTAAALSSATHLTRCELLRRRLQNLNLLSRHYRDLYWTLIHHLFTLYTTQYPFSPFEDDSIPQPQPQPCAFQGCPSNAMPLTSFCHLHILSDPKQLLYQPCTYVIQSAQDGRPITCMKPITRSTVPPLCPDHFEEAEKHLSRTLKMPGLNTPSTTKMAPKLHVILAEYVRHIQVKRLKGLKEEETRLKGLKEEETPTVDQNENDVADQVDTNMKLI